MVRGLIRELARLRPRFGSPRLSALVRRELGPVNHQSVERIYAQEGLQGHVFTWLPCAITGIISHLAGLGKRPWPPPLNTRRPRPFPVRQDGDYSTPAADPHVDLPAKIGGRV